MMAHRPLLHKYWLVGMEQVSNWYPCSPAEQSWIPVLGRNLYGAAFGWARSGLMLEINGRMVMSNLASDAKQSGRCMFVPGGWLGESMKTLCDDGYVRISRYLLPTSCLLLSADRKALGKWFPGRYYRTRRSGREGRVVEIALSNDSCHFPW